MLNLRLFCPFSLYLILAGLSCSFSVRSRVTETHIILKEKYFNNSIAKQKKCFLFHLSQHATGARIAVVLLG